MTKTTNNCKIFQSITENAVDFIQTAVKEFDKNPKYSLIHFATGVELFLKARLVSEHWTLIAEKNSVSYANLQTGDAKTIAFENLKTRINSVFPNEISEEASKTFKELAELRNKAIHFALSKNAKSKIVEIQCRGWYYLHLLITNPWKSVFDHIEKDIESLDLAMRQHRKYLEEKYERLQKQIENSKKNGKQYTSCPSCGFESFHHFEDATLGTYFAFSHRGCDVCGLVDSLTGICPKCKKETLLSGEQEVSCQHCHYTFSPEQLCNALDVEGEVAWCCNCETQTVVFLQGDWFCTNCFEKFETDEGEVTHCAYCNELIAVRDGNDYYDGCFLCGGRYDAIMEDDRI